MTNYDYLVKELNLSEPQMEAVVKLASICGMQTLMEAFKCKTTIKNNSGKPTTAEEYRIAEKAKELAKAEEKKRAEAREAEEKIRLANLEKSKKYWDKINARDEVAELTDVLNDDSNKSASRVASTDSDNNEEFDYDSSVAIPSTVGEIKDFKSTEDDYVSVLDDDDDGTDTVVSNKDRGIMQLVIDIGKMSPMSNLDDVKALAVDIANSGDKILDKTTSTELLKIIRDANNSIQLSIEPEDLTPIYKQIQSFRNAYPENEYGQLFDKLYGYNKFASGKTNAEDSVDELNATPKFKEDPKTMLSGRDYVRRMTMTPDRMNRINQKRRERMAQNA